MNNEFQLILAKAKQYSSIAERSLADIEKKCRQWKASDTDVEKVIAILQEENYINDIRYLRSFISDKFRFNKWGRIKIIFTLKSQGFDEQTIKNELHVIDMEEYNGVATRLIKQKIDTMPGEDFKIIKQKTINSLVVRGFETDMVIKIIDSLLSK